MTQLKKLQQTFQQLADPQKAQEFKRFFKTGKGQYGEGDVFLGISMPQQREAIKPFENLSFEEIQTLLNSEIHEFRMSALLILVAQFKAAKGEKRGKIYDFYLKNVQNVNNWDLVDASCRDIVGAYLFDKDRSKLYELATTNHLWSQRIAMVSTWYFIREKQLADTFKIAEILLSHPHDLMHKAVGWMLREAWKRDDLAVEDFLEEHAAKMPRTALRYAIETLPEMQRRYFMAIKKIV